MRFIFTFGVVVFLNVAAYGQTLESRIFELVDCVNKIAALSQDQKTTIIKQIGILDEQIFSEETPEILGKQIEVVRCKIEEVLRTLPVSSDDRHNASNELGGKLTELEQVVTATWDRNAFTISWNSDDSEATFEFLPLPGECEVQIFEDAGLSLLAPPDGIIRLSGSGPFYSNTLKVRAVDENGNAPEGTFEWSVEGIPEAEVSVYSGENSIATTHVDAESAEVLGEELGSGIEYTVVVKFTGADGRMCESRVTVLGFFRFPAGPL